MASLVLLMHVEDESKERESFRLALAQYRTMQLVYEADREELLLDYLETHVADVLILDTEEQAGDDLPFFDEMEMRGLKKPFIFVVTNAGADEARRYQQMRGVDFVYRKTNRAYAPERILCLIARLLPYQNALDEIQNVSMYDPQRNEEITKRYIENELEKLRMRWKAPECDYIVEAIFLMMEALPDQITDEKTLYAMVARACHGTSNHVKRGIRKAIGSIFMKMNTDQIQRYYSLSYQPENGRPTNMEFIRDMVKRLK